MQRGGDLPARADQPQRQPRRPKLSFHDEPCIISTHRHTNGRPSLRITALVDREVVSRRNPGELWAGKRVDVTMERDVVSTLRSSGHRVTILPMGEDMVDELELTAPDV